MVLKPNMRILLAVIGCSAWAFPASAAEVKPLMKSSTSWDGGSISYPQGTPEISAVQITIKPGEKLPFHCHPVPTFGFIQSGSLIVETADGKTHAFKKDDVVVEVMNTVHRGHNPSKTRNTVLIVFYAGATTTPTTFPAEDENCGSK